MTVLHIDFETRSTVDLKAAGLDNYAKDPRTEVLCMAFAFDDEPIDVWIPGKDRPRNPTRLFQHIRDGGTVCAHNAAFELAIWNNIIVPRFGWPRLKVEQCIDTMAMAYAMALPGALEDAAPATGIDQAKDASGKRLMLSLCKPKSIENGEPVYDNEPLKLGKLYNYCRQDVEVERALEKRLLKTSDHERRVYALDHRVNNRGVQIDLPLVQAAVAMVAAEKARLDAQMRSITRNAVASCNANGQLGDWIRAQGVDIGGVAKADVIDALAGELPQQVRDALNTRREAAKSSTAKLDTMLACVSADGRARNLFQYHGASTGRWAGRKIQLQNLPRPKLSQEEIEQVIPLILAGKRDEIDMLYGSVLDVISSCIRACLISSPGHDLIAVDFNAIEARVLAWLAGQESTLNIFRTHGKIYEHAASGIYGIPLTAVNKDQRQIGKVAVLALGYGGGVGAFQTMARGYGVEVSDGRADEIKVAWRDANPRVVQYWKALEDAAISAVQSSGSIYAAGAGGRQVRFRVRGSFLFCQLPSGRLLCYPYPELRAAMTPWGTRDALTFMAVLDSTTRKKTKVFDDAKNASRWARVSTYGGSLAENVTQAVARDLLADALLRLDPEYPIVAHVHDEIVVEIPSSSPASTLSKIESIIAEPPRWAADLPLSAEGWRASRYRK